MSYQSLSTIHGNVLHWLTCRMSLSLNLHEAYSPHWSMRTIYELSILHSCSVPIMVMRLELTHTRRVTWGNSCIVSSSALRRIRKYKRSSHAVRIYVLSIYAYVYTCIHMPYINNIFICKLYRHGTKMPIIKR